MNTNLNINEFGVITNEEVINIIEDTRYRGIQFRVAEYNNKWYEGIRISCQLHGCSYAPNIKHGKKFETKEAAIEYLYEYAIKYLKNTHPTRINEEPQYIEKLKQWNYNRKQLTLF